MARPTESSVTHLLDGFRRSVAEFRDRPALWVAGEELTYAELDQRAGRLAAALRGLDRTSKQTAAFLAYRSATAYASVLGILGAGKAYVPLNPTFPLRRTKTMLEFSGADLLIVGQEGIDQLQELLEEFSRPMTAICPDAATKSDLPSIDSPHTVLALEDCPPTLAADEFEPPSPTDMAYLLFTSGSTGTPKGVPVSHGNVVNYLDYVLKRYEIVPDDRFSQTFDMTFDLSVHDMFLCFAGGACLYCLPHRSVMAPASFINKHGLTVWFSVPSVVAFMQRMRMLKPGAFPSLRLSLFCGEPLLASQADAWQKAAQNSAVENLYGPTEATIAIAHYRWQPDDERREFVNGVVPIGNPFSSQKTAIVDTQRHPVAPGTPGELCLSGSQVTSGYLNNPEKTEQQFVQLPAVGEGKWYRTGDLARQQDDGTLVYLGRIDHQVQICGHRVELQEVDCALREASGEQNAVSVAWPVEDGRADGVYGFLCCNGSLEKQPILDQLRQQLPEYMCPRDVFAVREMPLNANGKVDRKALAQQVGELIREGKS